MSALSRPRRCTSVRLHHQHTEKHPIPGNSKGVTLYVTGENQNQGARNQDQERIRHTRSDQEKEGAFPPYLDTIERPSPNPVTTRPHTKLPPGICCVHQGLSNLTGSSSIGTAYRLFFYLFAILDLDQSHCLLFWMLLSLPP